MFVLRSAFWLTIGFVLMAPYGTDLGVEATTLTDQAISAGVEAGQQAIIDHVFDPNRLPDILLSSATLVEAPLPIPSTVLVAFPHPRPPILG